MKTINLSSALVSIVGQDEAFKLVVEVKGLDKIEKSVSRHQAQTMYLSSPDGMFDLQARSLRIGAPHLFTVDEAKQIQDDFDRQYSIKRLW